MFSSGPNYNKLKTNLRLAIQRLKLLEKKKSEMALKSRKEIADYLAAGKVERAKIRVEHIIREDYLVEAMEILEMFCDLLLARFGLIQQMKTLDDGLAEAISSLIWVAPRMQADIQELKIVDDQFAAKYGKPYAQACKENEVGTVSAKLMHKLSVQAPPKITVEKYLIEIAKYYNVEYEPDPQVMTLDEVYASDNLIDLMPPVPDSQKNDLDGNSGGGFVDPGAGTVKPFNYPQMNVGYFPDPPGQPAPPPPGQSTGMPLGRVLAGGNPYTQANIAPSPPLNYAVENVRPDSPNDNIVESKDDLNISDGSGPPPYEQEDQVKNNLHLQGPPHSTNPDFLDLPELPSVPSDTPVGGTSPGSSTKNDDIDFDDLTKRFEALKKKK